MRLLRTLLLVVTCWIVASQTARAVPTYLTDFQTDSSGFTNGGVLPALTRTSLPTDGGGLSSANQSMWLGPLGANVGKSTSAKEIVNLNVTGLTTGQKYVVAFDLFIGASWDGAASGYGTDSWYFAVNGTRLIDTMFSNGDQGIDYGAYSPQRYTDANYATPVGPDVAAYTGAEYSRKEGPGYSGYYGIYYFSHGAGNPEISFVAAGTSATFEWARYSDGANFGDSGDEYWAIDNIIVDIPVPEPATATILAAAVPLLALLRSKRR